MLKKILKLIEDVFFVLIVAMLFSCKSKENFFYTKEVETKFFMEKNGDTYVFFQDSLQSNVIEVSYYFEQSVIKMFPEVPQAENAGRDSIFLKVNDRRYAFFRPNNMDLYLPSSIWFKKSRKDCLLSVETNLVSTIKATGYRYMVFKMLNNNYVLDKVVDTIKTIDPMSLIE